jgi:hypothetical protein
LSEAKSGAAVQRRMFAAQNSLPIPDFASLSGLHSTIRMLYEPPREQTRIEFPENRENIREFNLQLDADFPFRLQLPMVLQMRQNKSGSNFLRAGKIAANILNSHRIHGVFLPHRFVETTTLLKQLLDGRQEYHKTHILSISA